jgi:RHS repeat-associated protein
LLLEFDAQRRLVRQNVYAQAVDHLLAVEDFGYNGGSVASERVIWTLADHQGSITELYAEGATPESLHYDPFGSFSGGGPLAASVKARYTGREYDPETGLFYYRARYYDPLSGRFLSPDPMGFAAGATNLYAYAGNSPTNRVDPTGLFFEDLVLGIPSIGIGLWSLGNDIEQGNVGWAIADLVGIVADAVAIALPFIPGGVGAAIKAYRAGDLALDATRATKAGQAALGLHHAANVIQAADTMANTFQTWDALEQGHYWQAALGGLHVGTRVAQTGLAVDRFFRNYEVVLPSARNLASMPSASGLSALTEITIRSKSRVAPNSGLIRGSNRSRVVFDGMEVRAVRDLSHVDDSTLRAMSQHGFAGKDINGKKLILHHLDQTPAGSLVEMPGVRHRIGNRVQHPLGNAPGVGLTGEQRAAYNAWRESYWKARALEELARRGVAP